MADAFTVPMRRPATVVKIRRAQRVNQFVEALPLILGKFDLALSPLTAIVLLLFFYHQ